MIYALVITAVILLVIVLVKNKGKLPPSFFDRW